MSPHNTRVTVRVIAQAEETGAELILSEEKFAAYDLDAVDASVRTCLATAIRSRDAQAAAGERVRLCQLSLLLSSNDPNVRPSLHLSLETVRALADVRVSFDFDPYTGA